MSSPALPASVSSQTTVQGAPPPSPAYGVQDPFGYHAARMVGEGRVPGVPNLRDYEVAAGLAEDYRYLARIVRDRLRDFRQVRGRRDNDAADVVDAFEQEMDQHDDVATPKYRTPATIPREVKRLRIDMKW